MNLHEMKLHEPFRVSSRIIAVRVPGGWIYEIGSNTGGYVFVPYSDEFNEGEDYEEDPVISKICGDKVDRHPPLNDSECPPLLVTEDQEAHNKATAGVHVPPVLGKFPGFAGKLVRWFEQLGDAGHFQSEKSCKKTMAILKQLTGEQAVACLQHAIDTKSPTLDKAKFTDWTAPTHNLPTREQCGIKKYEDG